MAVVAFDVTAFRARYPEFTVALAPDALLSSMFDEAGLYLNNTDNSVVSNTTTRGLLLNMLTAHIAKLAGVLDGGQAQPVGRITNASEGSVSAGFEMNGATVGSKDWYMQTQYGAAYWQASMPYRRMRYFSPYGNA